MKRGKRRGGSRRNRPRQTPKWLLGSQEIDQISRARCLMVLSVLSGETTVTDAIAEAGISRASYYQLETKALNAMLKALGPLSSSEGTQTSPVRQIAALEEKVKELERARRRTQRLLLMTRRVIRAPETKTSSTRRGRGPSPASRTKRVPKSPSSIPETTGEGAP